MRHLCITYLKWTETTVLFVVFLFLSIKFLFNNRNSHPFNWQRNLDAQRAYLRMYFISGNKQTLGTAACRVKLLMSESLELEAVRVTVRAESDCCSQLSVKVTPSFSYTVAVGAMENSCYKRFHSFKSTFRKRQKMNVRGLAFRTHRFSVSVSKIMSFTNIHCQLW